MQTESLLRNVFGERYVLLIVRARLVIYNVVFTLVLLLSYETSVENSWCKIRRARMVVRRARKFSVHGREKISPASLIELRCKTWRKFKLTSRITWDLWVVWYSRARFCGWDVMTLSTNQDFPVTSPTSAFLQHEPFKKNLKIFSKKLDTNWWLILTCVCLLSTNVTTV